MTNPRRVPVARLRSDLEGVLAMLKRGYVHLTKYGKVVAVMQTAGPVKLKAPRGWKRRRDGAWVPDARTWPKGGQVV